MATLESFTPRKLEFRARDVSELIGVPLSSEQIFSAADKTKGPEEYHRRYAPSDVRAVRRKINEAFDNWCNGGHLNADGLPTIIASHISKGGTGKTSLTANLAVALTKLGYNVLLVDGDPQFSCTTIMGLDAEDENIMTLNNALFKGEPLENVIIPIYEENNAKLDFIAADLFLNEAEVSLLMITNREKRLRQYMLQNKEFFGKYEFILFDTNPARTTLNYNILMSASLVLVPMFSDGLSAKAIYTLSATLQDLRDAQPDLARKVMVVLNNHNPALRHTREAMPTIQNEYGSITAESKIPSYVGFSRQVRVTPEGIIAKPLLEIEPTSIACKEIMKLAREIEALTVPAACIGDGGNA